MVDQKDRLKATFNAIASNYDSMYFLHAPANRLVELAHLSSGARVLDVATVTGLLALPAAQIVGPAGKLTGIDLSPDMLNQARLKLAAAGIQQAEFQEGDAEKLSFPDQSFEAVLCGSALFFIPDMLSALKEFRRVLVAGGCAGFNSFEPGFLEPLRGLWAARLQTHGLKSGSLPFERMDKPETCERLLVEAGFTNIEVLTEQLGYYLATPKDRWAEIMAGIEGMPLLMLPEEQREQIKAEHLAEMNTLVSSRGLWVDVPVIFAFGR
ncbi:MAG: methyltransferase domain-containing protein [Chloroflexi bacterium]|nr:methyltransferase domain-containing protein [Chloroflexota bacterium]